MLKVFLVEDEFIVREGIRNNIDWEAEGFQFCGDAADGELAFPLIKDTQPDIIITDICMPFMDGLELSRLVKKELPKSRIIILSGHEEFSYAKEAIAIGVTEYLLKPISGAELIKTVKRIGNQITRERLETSHYERYKREMAENEKEIRRRFFNELVSGSFSLARVLERAKELDIDLGAQYYQIILFKHDTPIGDESATRESASLDKELAGLYSRYKNVIVFDRMIDGIALLIKGDTQEELGETRQDLVIQSTAILARYLTTRYFGGIGKPVDRLTLLNEAFQAAAHAFSYRFILGRSAIISANDLPVQQGYWDNASLGGAKLSSVDLRKTEEFLKSGEADEIPIFVEEFLKSLGGAQDSYLLKQYILMNIYFTVVTFLREIGAEETNVEEPFTNRDRIEDMLHDSQIAKAYLLKLFTTAMETRDVLRNSRYHRVIEQAKEYIHEHYAEDTLSLNEVASYVHISPSHFSAVFSRETGSSMIKYLTDLRMAKAKELLKCTDMRCVDISLAVGYKDPHYFSYLFRKIHNCTPMQYRSSKANA